MNEYQKLIFEQLYNDYNLRNIMYLSNSTTQNQLNLLNVSQIPQTQLQKIYDNQNRATWKSLLKIEQSNRISNHAQAIQQLKLAKSQIFNFMRSTYTKSSQTIYQKILISIYCNLVIRLFCVSRYKQGMDFFKQMVQYLKTKAQIKQAIYCLFGFSSLYSIASYKLQNNHQFKYPLDIQISFLYLVGKIKKINKKLAQAKLALQKILLMNKSNEIGLFLLTRVYSYLADIDPTKYGPQYQKYKKSTNTPNSFSLQQKFYSEQIIKTLLNIQISFIQQNYEVLRQSEGSKSILTKDMLVKYLKKLQHKNYQTTAMMQNRLPEKYTNSLIQQIKKQTNPTILQQILEPQTSKIAQQAIQYYKKTFNFINKCALKYNFYRISAYSGQKKGNKDMSSTKVLENLNNVMQLDKKTNNLRQDKNNNIKKTKQSKSDNKSKQISILKQKMSLYLKQKHSQLTIQNIRLKNKDKIIKVNRRPLQDINRANQILKRCIQGSFLMKVNLGNQSVVRRFVRIQQKGLKWAQDQKQIDFSASICKWKHVISFFYGKNTQNLRKSKFWHYQAWRCFSLVTSQRSYDFYCENESDIFFWLQGLSYQLQKYHQNTAVFPFYSKGSALWNMMFMKMGIYRNPKKKYKSQKLASILGWKQNNKSQKSNKSIK